MRIVPHVNISGYPGAGKTTSANLLAVRHKTVWIPRVTTRPRRNSESLDGEYEFISRLEYHERRDKRQILRLEAASGHKYNWDRSDVYYRGTPHPKYWPKPQEDTELVLSVFGTRVAPDIKHRYAREMINICLVGEKTVLFERLIARATTKEDIKSHVETIKQYEKNRIEDSFDFVIDTTRRQILSVVEEIEDIAGIAKP